MKIGEKYNWLNEPDCLIYIGKEGNWHQFTKIGNPLGGVWYKVLDADLSSFEETSQPAQIVLARLVADLRLNHEYCPKEVILQAADALSYFAAIAQPVPPTSAWHKETVIPKDLL